MKLTKRETKPLPEKKSTLSNSQRELYCENNHAVIPYGKYANRTLGEIKKVDDRYVEWLRKEGLIYDWYLVRLRSESIRPVIQRKWSQFIASNGEIWLCLQECQERGQECPEWWLE